MNKPVDFELAKLLKEKGYDANCNLIYHGDFEDNFKPEIIEPSFKNSRYSEVNEFEYAAPTIAEVVMWLYDKHELWIVILPTSCCYFTYKIIDVQCNPEKPIVRPPYNEVCAYDYNTPTEAYIEAIKYCLNNRI